MKKRLSLVTVFVVVFGLTAGIFSAHAAMKDEVNLSGEWHMWVFTNSEKYSLTSFNTNVNGNPTYVLKQDGDNLILTAKGRFGDLQAKGTIKGNNFAMSGDAGKIGARFEGNFEDGKIGGKINYGFDEATFMMKRK